MLDWAELPYWGPVPFWAHCDVSLFLFFLGLQPIRLFPLALCEPVTGRSGTSRAIYSAHLKVPDKKERKPCKKERKKDTACKEPLTGSGVRESSPGMFKDARFTIYLSYPSSAEHYYVVSLLP